MNKPLIERSKGEMVDRKGLSLRYQPTGWLTVGHLLLQRPYNG